MSGLGGVIKYLWTWTAADSTKVKMYQPLIPSHPSPFSVSAPLSDLSVSSKSKNLHIISKVTLHMFF
jgi:hypothetical protein